MPGIEQNSTFASGCQQTYWQAEGKKDAPGARSQGWAWLLSST